MEGGGEEEQLNEYGECKNYGLPSTPVNKAMGARSVRHPLSILEIWQLSKVTSARKPHKVGVT